MVKICILHISQPFLDCFGWFFFSGQPVRSSTLSLRVRVRVSFSTPRGWPVPLPTYAFLHLPSILLFLLSLRPCPSPRRSSREGLVHIFILFLTHYCLPPPIRLSDDSSMMTHLLLIPSSHHLLLIISDISIFSIYMYICLYLSRILSFSLRISC